MSKKESIHNFISVVDKIIEQKRNYARMIAQSFNTIIPNEIFDIIIKNLRPNMKVTFFDDPIDMYYTLKAKEIKRYEMTPIIRHFYEVTEKEEDFKVLTEHDIKQGRFVKEYYKIIEDLDPTFQIGLPHVFYKKINKEYQKCIANEKNVVFKDEKINYISEERMYIYIPDIRKFQKYYIEIEKIKKERLEKARKEFLKYVKDIYKIKVNFQESLLKTFSALPFNMIEDAVELIYKYDQVFFVVISDPFEIDLVFNNAEKYGLYIDRKHSVYIERSLNAKIKLPKNSRFIPGEYNEISETKTVNSLPKFDPTKNLIFRLEINVKDLYYSIDDTELKNPSSTNYINKTFIYAYLPNDEFVLKYKKEKLENKKKNMKNI